MQWLDPQRDPLPTADTKRSKPDVDDIQPTDLAGDNDGDGCQGSSDLGALNGANAAADRAPNALRAGPSKTPEHCDFMGSLRR